MRRLTVLIYILAGRPDSGGPAAVIVELDGATGRWPPWRLMCPVLI